jgi:hypothetical protein
VDLFRPRAIPALIASLWVAAATAAVDCASLEGTYRFASSTPPPRGEPPETLADFTTGKERSKLYRTEAKGSDLAAWSASGLSRHPLSTALATKAALKRTQTKTTLQFIDEQGKTLVELGIDELGRWSCKGGHLERHNERTAGTVNEIRSERVEEILERNAAGDLVHRLTVTVLEPKGVKPTTRESVFPAIR